MKASQNKVKLFMQRVGQECPTKPCIPDTRVQALRLRLHKEEAVDELAIAFMSNDIEAVADSIGDSLVVVLGTAIACGINIAPIFNEIMQSNFSKVPDGYMRPDGKWMKGLSYTPPNLKPILDSQLNSNS